MDKNELLDDEEAGRRIEYFSEQLNLVFAYFFCTLEFEEEPELRVDPAKSHRAWALNTMQKACLYASLLAVRDIDDFFGEERHEDDLKALQLGVTQFAPFLTSSERKSINKLIVHSTIHSLGERKVWDIFEIASKCIIQSLSFLQWVEKAYGMKNFQTWSAAAICRKKTQSIHDFISGELDRLRGN